MRVRVRGREGVGEGWVRERGGEVRGGEAGRGVGWSFTEGLQPCKGRVDLVVGDLVYVDARADATGGAPTPGCGWG